MPRVKPPYPVGYVPRATVLGSDISAAWVRLQSAEREGNTYKADRARKRLYQLERIRDDIEDRTCQECGHEFKTVMGRRTHEALLHGSR